MPRHGGHEAERGTFTPSRSPLIHGERRRRGMNGLADGDKNERGEKDTERREERPRDPGEHVAMNVALVKSGPGVT